MDALGMQLPKKPGETVPGNGNAHALCLGPDWWLLISLPEAGYKLDALRSANDCHFSAVDVSGQRTTIELEGPHGRNLLAHLWDQDLREKNFPVGSVSQGQMARSPVIVWHVQASRYRVMVRSSFALHVWKALVDAAEEWM